MDLICFCHLRWNFVFQRPQHLISRFAKSYRVFYIEEPIFSKDNDSYTIKITEQNVLVVTLNLKEDSGDINNRQRKLIDHLFKTQAINKYMFWYYSPMFLPITRHLNPELTIYDCMDELSCFKFAPAEIKKLETELLKKAEIVFTGGHSLYEAKKHHHHNIYPFPSSIDKAHFAKARNSKIIDPFDQKNIPYPRIGFCGVIDERFDIELIRTVAQKKPDWQIVLIGPVVKIDSLTLPVAANIHYLGAKQYQELPSYIKGWQLTMIPFAINEATKYISPTKTPEYLAAGKPVISTAIKDVVHPYGTNKLVHIIKQADDFIAIAEKQFTMKPQDLNIWLHEVDVFLANNSWDKTWNDIHSLVKQTLASRSGKQVSILPINYNILSA
ncbi:glycosyltransferase [Ferruginibacter albus]|uniref:glycosyltransferase n=1 Tax=Ferruginibacter albus TaxID=2875540 RepID=UPI001CC3B1DB|nr:glycosyltransferase [Ferruginibacter albus]